MRKHGLACDNLWVHKLDLACKTAIQPLWLTSRPHRMDHAEKLRG
jgi:hypothetical protein